MPTEFSKLIHNRRTELNLTQTELAEKVMVSTKTISNWENDKTLPDLDSIIQLAKTLNISLDSLILEEPTMQQSIKASEHIKLTKKYWNYSRLTDLIFLTMLIISFTASLPYKLTLLICIGAFSNIFVVLALKKQLHEEQATLGLLPSKKDRLLHIIGTLIFLCTYISIILYLRYL